MNHRVVDVTQDTPRIVSGPLLKRDAIECAMLMTRLHCCCIVVSDEKCTEHGWMHDIGVRSLTGDVLDLLSETSEFSAEDVAELLAECQ